MYGSRATNFFLTLSETFWHFLTRISMAALPQLQRDCLPHHLGFFWHFLTRFAWAGRDGCRGSLAFFDTFWHEKSNISLVSCYFLTLFDTFWHGKIRFLMDFCFWHGGAVKHFLTRYFFDTFWHETWFYRCHRHSVKKSCQKHIFWHFLTRFDTKCALPAATALLTKIRVKKNWRVF